jgi:RNA polymerase sigma-70 factor (ECF subfamily)
VGQDPAFGEETDDVLAKLVRDARDGDERSFGRLAERVRARVYRWALAVTGDPDEAEDVTQEVLLRLHRHLSGFEGRSPFASWLYRITVNAASSARYRARRRAAASEAGAAPARQAVDLQNSSAEILDERLDAGRVAELVRVYLERLPARQRQVFDLVDLQGHAPREVAEMMQMNRNTVRAHLFKARRTIRGHILRHHPERMEDLA